ANKQNQSEKKIADAIIVIDNDKIKLSSIQLIENNQGATLNQLLVDKIESKKNAIFNENNSIAIDSNAILQLNVSSFNLSLDVDKSAFAPKEHA
ncbi:fimbrial biogenesis outer membrane usher protein, partial [Proteus mirabilis]